MNHIKCINCNSEKYQLLFKGKDRLHKVTDTLFNIVKCSDCGLVYLNPQPNQVELKKYYPDCYGPYRGGSDVKYGYISRHLRKIKNIFKKQNKNKLKIDHSIENYLDFGCGSVSNLEKVKTLHPNWNIFGSDNNELICKEVKEKGFKVFCGDILNLNLPRDFFNIVNMSHVIEHLNNPKETLIKINRSTKMNGDIVITTPNFDSLEFKLFKSYWFGLEIPRHLYFFTKKTIYNLLNNTGFKIINIQYDIKPETIIRSIYYIIGKKDLRVNPIVWRIFKPINIILSLLRTSSIITVKAKKISNV